MRTPTSLRGTARRALVSLALCVLLVAGGVSPSAFGADQTHDDAEVTISVTIDAFDPCAVGATGCVDGELATTGAAAVGLPFGVGVLLAAIGAALYARDRHRRPQSR